MIFRKILALIFLAALCMPGYAQTNKKAKIDKKEAAMLQVRNEELRAEIDSLLNLIETLQNAQQSKDDSGISLQQNKIEYSTETTDSLLSKWYQKKQDRDEVIEGRSHKG